MTRYITRDGDMLDEIVWRYYGARDGALEAVLDANPALAREDAVLKAGLVITLPPLAVSTAKAPLRLWD